MPKITFIDVKQSSLQSNRKTSRANFMALARGRAPKGSEVLRSGLARAERVKDSIRTTVKQKSIRQIAHQDKSISEKKADAVLARAALKVEKNRKRMKEEFMNEQNKGGTLNLLS